MSHVNTILALTRTGLYLIQGDLSHLKIVGRSERSQYLNCFVLEGVK